MASQLAVSQHQRVGAWQPSIVRRVADRKAAVVTSQRRRRSTRSSTTTTRALAVDDALDAVAGAASEASNAIAERLSNSAAVGDATAAVAAAANEAVRTVAKLGDISLDELNLGDSDLVASAMATVREAAGQATATAEAMTERISSGGVGAGVGSLGGEFSDAARSSLAAAAAAAEALIASFPGGDGAAPPGVDVDPMVAWQIESSLGAFAAEHPAVAGAAAAAGVAGASLAVARAAGVGGGDRLAAASAGNLPTSYDIPAIKAYWRARPLASLKRTGGLVARLVAWGAGLLSDVAAGPETVEANAPKRAAALRDVISEQGPAFVKVGQAVAIRPDLLPPAYLEELQKLLDQVAPFGSAEARALIQEQLGGARLEDVFEDVRAFDAPVAAASIGQVYRAKLRASGPGKSPEELDTWGGDVAVKVQRPRILEVVTLDLLVIRSLLEAAAAIPANGNAALEQIVQGAEGFIPVLDVAAERFLEELDYGLEADNASRFERDMASVEVVRGAVKVPHVFRGLSGRCVLTQEWVEGRKLTDITADPTTGPLRAKLVQTLLNSYMVQFLETGFLHADPHPGNFLLMPDGRLCILDYGMMTTISEDQRVAFIEYIAHLSARDYDKTLQDLVNLGFVPPELASDPVNRAVVVPVLAETLETLYGSGGGITKKTDALNAQSASRVGELSDKLEALAKDYPLQLPPYFVLILRAFGTLEGLGLSVDENYAIVDECFPYVARRMLADDSPRMRAALQSFVYGGSDRLKVSRVRSIAAGFSEFTNNMGETENVAAEAADALARRARTAATANGSGAAAASSSGDASRRQGEKIDAATRDALALVFSAEGNYLQEILVEEAVRAADALARGAASGAWRELGAAAPAAAALGLLVRPVGPFAPPLALIPGLNIPILLSLVASQNNGAIKLTLDDKRNLALLRSIAEFVAPDLAQRLGRASSVADRFNGVSEATGGARRGFGAAAGGGAPGGPDVMSAEEVRRLVGVLQEVAPTVAPGVQRMGGQFAAKLTARLAERSREDFAALSAPPLPGFLSPAEFLSALERSVGGEKK